MRHPWRRCGAKRNRAGVTAAVLATVMLPTVAGGPHERGMAAKTVAGCRRRRTAEAGKIAATGVTAPGAAVAPRVVTAQDVVTGRLWVIDQRPVKGQGAAMAEGAAMGLRWVSGRGAERLSDEVMARAGETGRDGVTLLF